MSFLEYVKESASVLDALVDPLFEDQIQSASQLLISAITAGSSVLVCGNGGSAADASHIAGELVGRYLSERPGLPVVALSADTAILTAVGNDYGYSKLFSRQVQALGSKNGLLWAISTSGNSENVILACKAARKKSMKVLGLTGQSGGQLANHTDLCIRVPSDFTPHIQQAHQVVYHHLCYLVEKAFVGLED